MGSQRCYIWGNPWRHVGAGGIMVQIIPVKVHHAVNFNTKRKWGAKNKFNFTAPLSSDRKEPCDYRRLLVSWQSGPFWSPGYVCSSDVWSANGLIFGSGSRKKKDTKRRFHVSPAQVYNCLWGCGNTAASPESHEAWIHCKFQPRHNLRPQSSAAHNVCTSEHSLLHSYIIAISCVLLRKNTDLNGAWRGLLDGHYIVRHHQD